MPRSGERTPWWYRPLPATLVVVGLVCVLVVLAMGSSAAYSDFTVNSGNNVKSVNYYYCDSYVRDIGAGGVTGTSAATRYYKLDEASGPTAADSSAGTPANGTYLGGVTYGASGPCPRDGARAVTLNGSSGYIGTSTATPQPTVFTMEIWFRTTTARGGMIMNLANVTSGPSTTNGPSGSAADKALYMGDTGRLLFSVRSGVNVTTLTSPATYNDGLWHMATVTVSSTGGSRLYVDGVSVGSDATMTTSNNNYTGYWRIGYDSIPASWVSKPTSEFFAGSVAQAAVYGVALSATQVSDHYLGGT